MISFEKFTLPNGLKVIVHCDEATPMAVINVLYNVGAKDENPAQTGFAHLFEHLMFGGSINVPDYDEPLQMAGGENNAYTTNDLTNYYLQLPVENIETGFWLESDRMLSLAFSTKSLDVQKKVVSEEFKEHYLNKPYGDVWFRLREMAYKVHPYRWMTIGKELSHIENAVLKDVKDFFYKYYRPNNAILVVAGNVTVAQVRQLAEKWFGDIEPGEITERNIPAEPRQMEARRETVYADVPLNAFYKCWHIANRTSKNYYVADIITEILGGGESARLHQTLVKEKKLFSNINCFHMGSTDNGLLTIEGKLVKGVTMEAAEAAVDKIIQQITDEPVFGKELQKTINTAESVMVFEDLSLMSRAASLAYYELLGDAALMNDELNRYASVTVADVQQYAQEIFVSENSNTLYYYSNNN